MLLQRVTRIILSILMCFSFSNNEITVHGSSSSAEKTVNDLNTVLQYCIGQMIQANFFSDTWTTYFPKVLPTAIPNNCKDGRIIPVKDADKSLLNVLNNKTLRIGIHTALLNSQYLFYSNESDTSTTKSKESDSTNATNSATKSNTSGIELSNAPGTLLYGFEPACLREVTRLLGNSYQMDIQPELVLIGGDDFFGSLKVAVDGNEVDMVWSTVTVSDERSKLVNFACNTHMSEYVIGASAKVGSDFPNPQGPAIPLGCYAISCTYTNIPAPFVLKPIPYESEEQTLTNTSDEFEYILMPYENLWNYVRTVCGNCSQVLTPETIGASYYAPFTKFYNQTSSETSSSTRLMLITTMVSVVLSVMYHVIGVTCG